MEGKVTILSYVKGVEQEEDMCQMVEEKKEQRVGATTKEVSKEY